VSPLIAAKTASRGACCRNRACPGPPKGQQNQPVIPAACGKPGRNPRAPTKRQCLHCRSARRYSGATGPISNRARRALKSVPSLLSTNAPMVQGGIGGKGGGACEFQHQTVIQPIATACRQPANHALLCESARPRPSDCGAARTQRVYPHFGVIFHARTKAAQGRFDNRGVYIQTCRLDWRFRLAQRDRGESAGFAATVSGGAQRYRGARTPRPWAGPRWPQYAQGACAAAHRGATGQSAGAGRGRSWMAASSTCAAWRACDLLARQHRLWRGR
jgi:hypothetical protein